jgi:hypothetical protein
VIVSLATGRSVRPAAAFAWMTIGYTLFAPHLSSTEDQVLLIPMLLLWRWPGAPHSLRRTGAALALLPQFVGGSAAVFLHTGAPLLPLLAFVDKLGLAACTILVARRASAPAPVAAQP